MQFWQKEQTGNWGEIKVVHVFVVCLSLLLTLFAWNISHKQSEKQTALRFEIARDNTVALIKERMTKYEDALWGGVAAVESHGGDISYEEWHMYARTLQIEQKYPGINGIGIIHFQTEQTFGPYLAKQRQSRPNFRVFPQHDHPIYMPITFVEPENLNAAAIGLDVAHEENRRQAAQTSADTGTATITGPITLVQDAGATPGFLFYAPFYRGSDPGTPTARRKQILGAVYAPFVVHKLVEGLLAQEFRTVRFSIRDAETTIYDEHDDKDPQYDPDPMFAQQVSLDLYGRTWVLDIRSNMSFRTQNSLDQSTFILVGGLIIEGLIITLFVMMARATKRASRYADQVTRDLQHEKQHLAATNKELSQKNAEIEQYAYVASHDLKTPIRGISGLTEMIEDDLEPYFSSVEANPDVQKNLKSIHKRVAHMSSLTRGIMDFARVDATSPVSDPLDLHDFLMELAFDLELGRDQLTLASEVGTVQADTVNLRSVLENLITNAAKYHDGKQRLHVTVKGQRRHDRLHFEVSDNGPGIDETFHEKVFDVFQTLHHQDVAGSTGIGLSIVKKAVERNNGTIKLVSSLGNGATFIFDWPIGPEQITQSTNSKAA